MNTALALETSVKSSGLVPLSQVLIFIPFSQVVFVSRSA